MKTKTLAGLAFALLAGSTAALAAPVTWTLDGLFFQGGTASGSFVYDADTSVFSNIALTTSPGRTYTQFAGQSPAGLVFLQSGVTTEQTIALSLKDIALSLLTDAEAHSPSTWKPTRRTLPNSVAAARAVVRPGPVLP